MRINYRQPQSIREASRMGPITPEAAGTKASGRTPLPGFNWAGSDISDWYVVVSGPFVLPPLSQGIFAGKMMGRSNLDVPREVLVDPVGIGTQRAYVARVASRVYTQELDTLGDLEERSERETCTSRDKSEGEVNFDEVSRDGKNCNYRPLQATPPRIALKTLNTSRHLEIGKHVNLGTEEAILRRETRFRIPKPWGR